MFQISAQCVTACWVTLDELLFNLDLNSCTLKNKSQITFTEVLWHFGGLRGECNSVKYFHCISQQRMQNSYSVNVVSLISFLKIKILSLDSASFLHSPVSALHPIRTALVYRALSHSQMLFLSPKIASILIFHFSIFSKD